MTPNEKAKELIDNYNALLIDEIYDEFARKYAAKSCALFAVDEILNTLVYSPTDYGASITVWGLIKDEIEKL
jgi:hypothetical protein